MSMTISSFHPKQGQTAKKFFISRTAPKYFTPGPAKCIAKII
jgi:hypothetical protein